ncbi:hypothetical protein Tco_0826592 [Tanacetum coccineum]
MPPRMTTRSAGQPTAAPQSRGMGERVGRGARRTRELVRRNNETIGELYGQGNDQGVEANRGVDGVPDFFTIISQQLNQNDNAVNGNTQGDDRNVIMNNDRRGCTYKEFLACNPKEYDVKGGAIVYTRWIEKMESVQDISGCGDNQKVKYTTRSFVGKVSHGGTLRSIHESERPLLGWHGKTLRL